jgi:hypothetical protein
MTHTHDTHTHTYTYKLTFSNGKKFKTITSNLCEAHEVIVKYMNSNEDVTDCHILCDNGSVRRVVRTGRYHWNHFGYEFY